MASTTINNPNNVNPYKLVKIETTANTANNIKLANSGAYLGIFMGNATQSVIFTALVGSSGNVSHTAYGPNASYVTFTDGTGTGILGIQAAQGRNVYIMSLNGAAPAYLTT